MSNPDGVARRCPLPSDEFAPAWNSIMLAEGIRERLLAESLLSFTVRQKLPFESAPLHGLILLTGAPGTGKTTLARGLANQVAKQLSGTKCTFVEIDPHALMSSAHGRSQQAVAKLFEHTIPELAMAGAAIVLLDEVETLAVSRHQLSLEANPTGHVTAGATYWRYAGERQGLCRNWGYSLGTTCEDAARKHLKYSQLLLRATSALQIGNGVP